MARIVLNPFGSFGDLHPYLALALGLKERGHQPVIATSAIYREKVEAEGLPFAAVRPDAAQFLERPEMAVRLWDTKRGTEYLLRDVLIPEVRAAYSDLRPLCDHADLLVTHMAAFGGPLAGEHAGIPWLSVALQPAALFSAFDPMVLPQAPGLRHLYRLGTWFPRLVFGIGDRQTSRWASPILQLRRELELPVRDSPVMRGQFSPHGTLALFSRSFAAPQADWPPRTTQTGFLFYDHPGAGLATRDIEARLKRRLQTFLGEGGTPVLFTLGSSAVMQAGNFFDESLAAARAAGLRAILLVGPGGKFSAPSSEVFVAPYLRYSEVMPHVAAVVHQGGIGTTAQTLRAGKPALVVPWAHDQPDNAHRLERLGVARVLRREQYRASTVARKLRLILNDSAIFQRAAELGQAIEKERSLEMACAAVESALRRE